MSLLSVFLNIRFLLLLLFVGIAYIVIVSQAYSQSIFDLNSKATTDSPGLRHRAVDIGFSSSGNVHIAYTTNIWHSPLFDATIGSNLKMSIPGLLYGTAWKKERTKDLVYLAVKTGFRGIDTACQPRHYNEPGVGDALLKLYADNIVKREDIFLQTKFTPERGQDPSNIPYDPTKSLPEQVLQSFQVSCKNLHTDYLDSLVLHSNLDTMEDTITVWKSLESIQKSGGARYLGLSNTYDLKVLKRIYDAATVKPSFLQNRFYRNSNYDNEIRRFCDEHSIVYQSFWTLTANPQVIASGVVKQMATKYSKTGEQIFFRFVRSLGITILTGTTSAEHMEQDLAVLDESFVLEKHEIEAIAKLLH